jgi:hypothetical protein
MLANILLFPIHYHNHTVPFSVMVVFIITIALISVIIQLFYKPTTKSNSLIFIIDIIKQPLLFLLLCYSFYAAFDLTQLYFPHTFNFEDRFHISYYLSLIEILVLLWVIFRAGMASVRLLLGYKVDNN